jgi:hypothetical protein
MDAGDWKYITSSAALVASMTSEITFGSVNAAMESFIADGSIVDCPM